ncbi:MAG: hypothetical protein M3Z09_06300 [Acidobacteriota bacterium]|nr:hypothetical protein [Acidobacteriota bacterium]
MKSGWTVRLRPTSPWRIGGASGERDSTDLLYHSDTLYSAVTSAMGVLGERDAWLAATATNPQGPAVRFSSCFPFIGQTGLITPPRTLWPPPPSAKVRWKGAKFVPLTLVRDLIAGTPLNDDAWTLDGPSQCLVQSGRLGPFRKIVRKSAAVDRLTGQTEPHSVAGLEFSPNSGLWCRVAFHDDEAAARWTEPVQSSFRWLADSGFGGERSQGWGRAEKPYFSKPSHLHDEVPEAGDYWLLSLYVPGPEDRIDWSRGSYSVTTRSGRVESPVRAGQQKKSLPMIEEGSVLSAACPPEGSAPDVAPGGFPHPVFRFGFVFAIPLHEQVFA